MAGSGRAAESVSGGDGLLANPRSRPTPLSDDRTPPSESVGWLLLLFATEKQLKKKSFSDVFPKKRKRVSEGRGAYNLFFLCTFGAKSTKSLRTSFSAGGYAPRRCPGRARSGPMRHPVTAAPRVAFSFSASNESAESLCRHWRHCLFYNGDAPRQSYYPQGGSRLGSDGERASGGLKARAAGTVCLQTRE